MRQVADKYTQVIIRMKTTSASLDPWVRWQADIPKWLSIQRQHLLILTHASGGRRIYPSGYLYKDNIHLSWLMLQVADRYTQVIIRTKTTSVDPDLCIRWQTDLPKWLSVLRQHSLILTDASGGRWKYPQAVIRTHTVLLPRPLRSQVAYGDTHRLSAHTDRSVTRPLRIGWHVETPKGYPYTHLCYPDHWEVR